MTGTDWAVVIAGAGAIAWVNWYFFVAQRSAPRVSARVPGPTLDEPGVREVGEEER